jgi:hypothetical protein
LYAVAMVGVAVAASACAFAVARAVGGIDSPAVLTAGVIGVVSLVGLLPILVRSAEHFGLAVLGASVARLLLAMFAAVVLTEVGGAASRPVWLGVVAGSGLALVAEATLAVVILSSMERQKAGQPGAESSTTC